MQRISNDSGDDAGLTTPGATVTSKPERRQRLSCHAGLPNERVTCAHPTTPY